MWEIDQNGREITYETIPFTDEAFPIRVLPDLVTRAPSPGMVPHRISWHEQLELLYVLEGTLHCECDFREYVCHAGDIMVIHPCEPHAVNYAGSPARYHCIMVDARLCCGKDDAGARQFIDPIVQRRVTFCHVLRRAGEAAEILEALLREHQGEEAGYELAVRGHLLRLIAHLYRYEREWESTPRQDPHRAIAPALRYIADHYAEHISLSALTASCCMNESYFCRRFRVSTGRTAVGYINEYRMTKAKALLMTTGLSVADIAAATGFDDSSYFARKFKEIYHISPTAMREGSAAGQQSKEEIV